MDGFFDKYGRVIIIAVAICFVLLYLTPMRNVVGSSINGFAGNFANKVGESLETVKMPDGSDNIAKEKSSMIIGFDGSKSQFANTIPEQATAVVFTDEVAPEGVSTTDLTVAKDGDVVGWLEGTTWKVSTQNPRKAVTFNENCTNMFVVQNGFEDNKLSGLTHISFDNVDTSNVTNMHAMFWVCPNLTSLDVSGFDTSNVTDMSGINPNGNKHFRDYNPSEIVEFAIDNLMDIEDLGYYRASLIKELTELAKKGNYQNLLDQMAFYELSIHSGYSPKSVTNEPNKGPTFLDTKDTKNNPEFVKVKTTDLGIRWRIDENGGLAISGPHYAQNQFTLIKREKFTWNLKNEVLVLKGSKM